jgi:hypothetical protein
MNNPDHIPYDDSDLFDTNEAIIDLMSEGYSRDEATRMVGEYDPEDYEGTEVDLDRDVPEMSDFDASDFVDGDDFE